jgi:asparagine synthase (glutamine-hydrolysing)
MFSFILLDDSVTPSRMVVARDPIGITTLYTGWNSSNPSTRWFASELKSLQEECDVIQAFPPGHVYDSNTGETTRYFDPDWWNGDSGKQEDIPHGEADLTALRESLEKAVRKRLMSEVPFGVLLSGGLDSSLVASIASREMNKIAKEQQAALEARQKKIQAGQMSGTETPIGAVDLAATETGLDATPISWSGGALHSYAIGLEGSPDLLAARKAANFLGTRHSEYVFTTHEA